MALFRVSNERAQFDAAGNDARDQYGAGIRFTQGGNARVTTGSATNYNQGIPMSATGQVAIVDATAGLPAGTIFHNGLPISGDKVCVSRNATAVVSNGTPYDSAGAVAADINLDLNFIGTDTLNSSVTFTRASSATFVGSNGLIQSATTNTPRFDYDPVTLAAKGLLIEEQRTNLATYSEDFTQASVWNAQLIASTTPNATTAPDGTTTADLVIPNGTSGQHRVDRATTITAAPHAWSVFVKAAGYGFTWIRIGSLGAVFDLSTGAISSISGGVTASVTQYGSGWWRCIVSCTAVGNDTVRINALPTASTADFSGDGTSGIFIWGAQLETGSFATSYIPTVASQVTRSADVASVNTLSPWYNAAEGTLFAEWAFAGYSSFNPVFDIGSDQNNLLTLSLNSSVIPRFSVVSGAVTQVNLTLGSAALPNLIYKQSGAYKQNDFAACLNGGTVVTDTSGTVPSVTQATLGGTIALTRSLNGHIRRITYYPRKLSSAELQAITA